MDCLDDLKIAIREDEVPYFSDEQLTFFLKENNGDYQLTAYKCLCIKAETTTLSVSGLSLPDSSRYFRRLASQYRPHHSGVLSGGF